MFKDFENLENNTMLDDYTSKLQEQVEKLLSHKDVFITEGIASEIKKSCELIETHFLSEISDWYRKLKGLAKVNGESKFRNLMFSLKAGAIRGMNNLNHEPGDIENLVQSNFYNTLESEFKSLQNNIIINDKKPSNSDTSLAFLATAYSMKFKVPVLVVTADGHVEMLVNQGKEIGISIASGFATNNPQIDLLVLPAKVGKYSFLNKPYVIGGRNLKPRVYR